MAEGTDRTMFKALEHNEHASHLAHGHEHEQGGEAAHDGHVSASERSNQMAALLVAALAACLAITEQGAKHAEIRTELNTVLATDAWAQYQAKSTRDIVSIDVANLVNVLGPADPELTAQRKALLDKAKKDSERFEHDPKDGKGAIAERAHGLEEERDKALEQTHAYHNGSAAMELGIVLSTASAITKSRMLIFMALGLGIAGGVLALLGYFKPEWGAF